MTTPEDIIGQSVARLNEATAAAHEVLTELRGTTKDLKQTIKEGRQLSADLLYLSANLAKKEVDEEVRKHIHAALEELGAATKAETAKATAKVLSEFDKLADILMGREKGKVPLDELIRNNRERF